MSSFRDGDSAKYARANKAYTKWCETIDDKLEQRYGKGHGMNMHGGLVAEKQRGDPVVKTIVDKLYGDDAPTPSPSAEERLQRLVGALEGYLGDVGDTMDRSGQYISTKLLLIIAESA